MIDIVSAQTGSALAHVITLSQEYVNWMVAELQAHYPDVDLAEFTAKHDYDDVRHKFPGEHVPPDGGLLLAQRGTDVCGCVAVGRLTDSVAEMRTLFVRPAFRGLGVGKKLAVASLEAARALGYRHVRLDTLAFMESALGLYHALGFVEIAPYRVVSSPLQRYIRFLELDLAALSQARQQA